MVVFIGFMTYDTDTQVVHRRIGPTPIVFNLRAFHLRSIFQEKFDDTA